MVAEVEGRMRDRDEQQIRRLDMQMQDLKQLYSQNFAHQPSLDILGVSPVSKVESSSAATMSNVTSADVDPDANAGGHPAPSPSAQDERPPTRDARYAGTVGALAGAAVITVWNALFH